jgi:hypothetical protein
MGRKQTLFGPSALGRRQPLHPSGFGFKHSKSRKVGLGSNALASDYVLELMDEYAHAHETYARFTIDNLSATFSPELADLTVNVIDVAEGEKISRKGGPGITKSDFLVINEINLAPYVGARWRSWKKLPSTCVHSGRGALPI